MPRRDTPDAQKQRPPGKAEHGFCNEVSWDEGRGRQPYANQGEREAPPGGFEEAEGGDRGAHSGVNQEQFRRVKGTP